MTLRARLTGAFLAVVLGPVLLGAVFVGGTVTAVNRNRSIERLDLAASSVRTSIAGLCRQLRTVADSVAVLTANGQPVGAARQVVEQGLASAVRLTDPAGAPTFTTENAPPQPWADCAGPPAEAADGRRYQAISAGVAVRDSDGNLLGHASVAQVLDLAALRRLAEAAGAAVTLLGGEGPSGGVGPSEGAREAVGAGEAVATGEAVDADPSSDAAGPGDAALSTETETAAPGVAAAGERTATGAVEQTEDGRYVRREGPVPDQPLPLALSVPGSDLAPLYALLLGVVLATALAAVAGAWWLARSTTRPLAELAAAVDRVAGGDLAARVPVREPDELGRLSTAFNQMTHEMQSYVQALTASRDQLRGHLVVLGDTLSSTHDLGRILQVLLQTALAATGARAGVVLLADPATGVLIGQCAEGLTDRLSPAPEGTRLRLPIGAGLLGDVAATRQPRRGRVDRDGPVLCPGEPGCVTYVAVPFGTAGGSTGRGAAAGPGSAQPAAGVLALYDRLGHDEFGDDDLAMLRNLSAQVAVAVENVRVHEEARRLSVTDPLTGLLNYRSLVESLRREVERANRFKRKLGVLALDLDRFKTVNDSYGHAAGDAVLAECARRIRTEVREVDLAFRRGGEEFVILLPETDAAGAAVVSQRLGGALRDAPIVVTSGARQPGAKGPARVAVSVTVSVGIAVYPEHGETGQRVLEAADDALYAAKAAGRDTYRLAAVSDGSQPPTRTAVLEPEPGSGPGTGGVASGPQPPRQSRGG